MSAPVIPAGASPEWKTLSKFLIKSNQMAKIDPVISYYLKMYVVQQSIKTIKNRSAADESLLNNIMTSLEGQKPAVANISRTDAKKKMEDFSNKLFKLADDDDRAGNANKEVALQFHTAFVLIEASKQFGDLTDDQEQKRKYAMWKTADITKALKEGRDPKPGGFGEGAEIPAGGDEATEAANPAQPPSFSSSAPPPSSNPAVSSSPSAPSYTSPPPSTAAAASAPRPSAPAPAYPIDNSLPFPSSYIPPSASNSNESSRFGANGALSPPPGPLNLPLPPLYQYSPSTPVVIHPIDVAGQRISKIQGLKEGDRMVKHALAALAFDDAPTAMIKLQQAIAILAPFSQKERK